MWVDSRWWVVILPLCRVPYYGDYSPTILWLVLYLPTRHPVGSCVIIVGGMVGLGGTERLKELS